MCRLSQVWVLEDQASLRVKDHGGEEQGKVDHRDFKEIAGERAGLWRRRGAKDAGEAEGVPKIGEAEEDGGDGVGPAGDAEPRGPERDGNHEDGVEDALDDGRTGGVFDRLLSGGDTDASLAVVLTIEPADGHEVRELPDEEDGEERDGDKRCENTTKTTITIQSITA